MMMLRQHSTGFAPKGIKAYKKSYFASFLRSAGITALASDGRIVLFSTTSLYSSGIIDSRTAIVCMCGAQTTALIANFMAVIDDTSLIYLLLGIGGITSFFLRNKKCEKTKKVFLFLMSISVLLFGMNEMKDSLAFIGQNIHVKNIITLNHNSGFLVFIFGGILSFIMQSTGAVSFMAVSFYGSGILTHDQAVWFLFGGTCLGSTIRNQIYSFTFTGSSRRLLTIFANRIVLSALIAITQYLFQIHTGIPMLNGLFRGIYDNIIFEVFFTFFTTDAICTILMLTFMNPLIRIYEKLLPDDEFEKISKAMYITNINSLPKKEWGPLIKKEMARISEKLFDFLDIYISKNNYKFAEHISTSNRIIIDKMLELYKEAYDDYPECSGDRRLYEKMLILNNLNRAVTKVVKSLYDSKITNYCKIIDAMLQHIDFVLMYISDFMKKDKADLESLNFIHACVLDTKSRKELLSDSFILGYNEYKDSFRFEFASAYYDILHYCREFVESYTNAAPLNEASTNSKI